jgi:hypothetical protein
MIMRAATLFKVRRRSKSKRRVLGKEECEATRRLTRNYPRHEGTREKEK